MRARGTSMVTVLVVTALSLTVAFLLAGSAFSHLGIAGRFGDRQRARNAAESALAAGMERVLKEEAWGQQRLATQLVEVRPDTGTSAALACAEDVARRKGCGWSTNNLKRDTSVPGWNGRIVPPNAVHLVATGRSGASERTVEALIHFPPFPFALSSSGKVKAEGGLLVAAVQDPQDVAGGVGSLPPDKLRPGHMASNASGDKGVELTEETRITGDLRSAGFVDLNGASVGGEVVQKAPPRKLPQVDITTYKPTGPGVQSLGASLESPTVEGNCLASAPLVRIQGDLNLDGGVLYVEGDLEVTGTITGKGAVIVTGNTTVSGTARIDSDNEAALLSRGNVTITGSTKEGSFFQGLVYTEGDFQAADVTLVGAMVANAKDADGSAMTLHNVNVIQDSSATKLDVKLKVPPEALAAPPVEQLIGPPPSVSSYLHLAGSINNGQDASLRYDAIPVTYHSHVMTSTRFMASASDGGHPPTYNLAAITPDSAVDLSMEITRWTGNPPRPNVLENLGRYPYSTGVSAMSTPPWNNLLGGIYRNSGIQAGRVQNAVAQYNNAALNYRARAAQAVANAKAAAERRARFDFDLNRFIPKEDTLRVLYWGEVLR